MTIVRLLYFQVLEKKYSVLPNFLSQMFLVNVIESVHKNELEVRPSYLDTTSLLVLGGICEKRDFGNYFGLQNVPL